jgi:hypothetical protein
MKNCSRAQRKPTPVALFFFNNCFRRVALAGFALRRKTHATSPSAFMR